MRAWKVNLLLGLAIGLAAPASAYDFDQDGVDDETDVCFNTPPGIAVDAEGRPVGDIDKDCDTDLDDFNLLQQSMTGPLEPFSLLRPEMVAVGNSGNADDTHGDGYGGVAYNYKIGTYEVTAGEYTRFLKSVAATDAYGLYNPNMWLNDDGCKIRRTGHSGSYRYSIGPNWTDRPVNYVSWGDAARFANWMANGQPTGAQDLTTTEDGSYYLDGATSDEDLLAVTREPDAVWVIPSQDEWYKAAYHSNDGPTGNYWDYPTASNAAPTAEAPPGTDLTNGSANYFDGDYAIGAPHYRSEVGAYDAMPSASPYGTFDQGGNVEEWTEEIFSASARGLRGGSFDGPGAELLASTLISHLPSEERGEVGFRLAERPFYEMVTVGNPGNPDDVHGDGYGGVAYTYDIGKYEVTAGQYTVFLNAVAASDPYGLYDEQMNQGVGSFLGGCKIVRSGSEGSYTYSVEPDRADRPVNFILWLDAARFANWMHNGRPTGAQDLTTTEDGSYFIDGRMSWEDADGDGVYDQFNIQREPDATWVLPTEHEWYKAAYHQNDGPTGNYFLYPTSSDNLPDYVTDGGDLSGTGGPFTDGGTDPGNYATWDGDLSGGCGFDCGGIGPPYHRSQVGEWENSGSPYGTFDQAGNVWEHLEAHEIYEPDGWDALVFRGGNFHESQDFHLGADYRQIFPWGNFDDNTKGIRLVELP